jgi:hypothetical protein
MFLSNEYNTRHSLYVLLSHPSVAHSILLDAIFAFLLLYLGETKMREVRRARFLKVNISAS